MIYEILSCVLFCYLLITSFFLPQLSLVDEALHTVSMFHKLFIITCDVKRRNHGMVIYVDGDLLAWWIVLTVITQKFDDKMFEHYVFISRTRYQRQQISSCKIYFFFFSSHYTKEFSLANECKIWCNRFKTKINEILAGNKAQSSDSMGQEHFLSNFNDGSQDLFKTTSDNFTKNNLTRDDWKRKINFTCRRTYTEWTEYRANMPWTKRARDLNRTPKVWLRKPHLWLNTSKHFLEILFFCWWLRWNISTTILT